MGAESEDFFGSAPKVYAYFIMVVSRNGYAYWVPFQSSLMILIIIDTFAGAAIKPKMPDGLN